MSVVDGLNKAYLSDPVEPSQVGTWFEHARYGLFLHWGLYSLLGRGEWARNREQIPANEYQALAHRFSAEGFDASHWALLAERWGMRYGVLTTKHHDGFCLWNSKTCSFNSVNSAAQRDLTGEFIEAFRSRGLRVGLYYSLGDWNHPDWQAAALGDKAAERRFVEYTHSLVTELMSQYGRIDVLWYDLPQGLSAEQWRSAELNRAVRQLQPGILINNRSMLPEDFSISEQHIQAPPQGRMWEACMTLNESWAFVQNDRDFKTPRQVVRTLAKVASMGGNLLLNVGPEGSGLPPAECVAILDQVRSWLDRNGESVYNRATRRLPFNLWGTTSVAGTTQYLFLERYFGEELVIGGLTPDVLGARILGVERNLSWERRGDQIVIRGMPAVSPDPILTVLRLDLDGEPDQTISRVIAGADIMARFPD